MYEERTGIITGQEKDGQNWYCDGSLQLWLVVGKSRRQYIEFLTNKNFRHAKNSHSNIIEWLFFCVECFNCEYRLIWNNNEMVRKAKIPYYQK